MSTQRGEPGAAPVRPTGMTRRFSARLSGFLLAPLAALLVSLLVSCSADGGTTAVDPAPADRADVSTASPAAPGLVRTAQLVTALDDAAVPEPTSPPEPATAYDEAELARIAGRVRDLGGARAASATPDGHVVVDVVYDDGSLQAWADATFGQDLVLVLPGLVDTEAAPGGLPG